MLKSRIVCCIQRLLSS